MEEIIVNADIIMLINIVPMCLCVQYFEWSCVADAGQVIATGGRNVASGTFTLLLLQLSFVKK